MNEMIEVPRKRPPAVTLERVLLASILVLQAAILVSLHTSASGGRILPPASAATSRTAPAADAPPWNSVSNAAVGLSAPHAAVPRDDIFARPHTIDSLLEQAMADFERMERLINLDEGWSSLRQSPTLDMRDQGDCYVVVFSLPGLEESDVRVTLDGRLLTVMGDSATRFRHSRDFSTYVRSVLLPGPVAGGDKAQAVLTNGVLRIMIPKSDGTSTPSAPVRLH